MDIQSLSDSEIVSYIIDTLSVSEIIAHIDAIEQHELLIISAPIIIALFLPIIGIKFPKFGVLIATLFGLGWVYYVSLAQIDNQLAFSVVHERVTTLNEKLQKAEDVLIANGIATKGDITVDIKNSEGEVIDQFAHLHDTLSNKLSQCDLYSDQLDECNADKALLDHELVDKEEEIKLCDDRLDELTEKNNVCISEKDYIYEKYVNTDNNYVDFSDVKKIISVMSMGEFNEIGYIWLGEHEKISSTWKERILNFGDNTDPQSLKGGQYLVSNGGVKVRSLPSKNKGEVIFILSNGKAAKIIETINYGEKYWWGQVLYDKD